VWYRLLNCGFHLPAAAGTDAMANYASLRGPVGLNRVYASVPAGALNINFWLDSIKHGHTFATNGPLLGFTLGSRQIGDEVRLPAGENKVKFTAWMRSFVPIDHLQIVCNGQVVRDLKGSPESIDVAPPRLLPFVTTTERNAWEAKKAGPEPKIQAMWDRGEPSPTYIYRRGDYLLPGTLVGPGVPSVLTDGKTPFEVRAPWPGAKQTGRRLAFAKWVAQSSPLTARVMVNRIWKHHFGTGIVPTLANFGKAGVPQSGCGR